MYIATISAAVAGVDMGTGAAIKSREKLIFPDPFPVQHSKSWLHLDREKDCGLKIPLTSPAKFQLEESLPVKSRTKKIFAFSKVV